MNDGILQYEKKGLSYWWILLSHDRSRVWGRGIVEEEDWKIFLHLFDNCKNGSRVDLEERRMS